MACSALPVDEAARNTAVEAAFLDALPQGRPPHLTDLASGTGATVAALAPRLAQGQRWLLTDHDPALLAQAKIRLAGLAGTAIDCRETDLAAGFGVLDLAATDGVTTSAFLDLVTAAFADALAAAVSAAGKPFLASLTYDGRAVCFPPHPLDETVRLAMNAHQQTDKGFGPALGPDAAAYTIGAFERAGYRVVQGTSDWQAGPEQGAFQEELVRGWADAARDMGIDAAGLAGWLAFRLAEIAAGRSTLQVGHLDIAALPH
ncbi:glycosyl transferase family 1 [Pannonibacter sp. Pt2-lr]